MVAAPQDGQRKEVLLRASAAERDLDQRKRVLMGALGPR